MTGNQYKQIMHAFGTGEETIELAEGTAKVIKTAKPVVGELNTWDIKVRVEYKDKMVPTDTVITLDRSGSMMDGERDGNGVVEQYSTYTPGDEKHRLTLAKKAIRDFTNTMLYEGSHNKLALNSYSYGYNFSNQQFSQGFTVHSGLQMTRIRFYAPEGTTIYPRAVFYQQAIVNREQ